MSTEIPEIYLTPLRSLAGAVHAKALRDLPDLLRDAAEPLVELDHPGEAARTGGVFGAHLLRLWGADLLNQDNADAPTWAPLLAESASLLPPEDTSGRHSRAGQLRYALAGQLRHLPGGRPQDEYGTQLSKWLVAEPYTVAEAAAATAYARRLLQSPQLLDQYGAGAWWSVYAWDLAEAADLDKPLPAGGRPRAEDTTQRARHALALGAYSARRWTKTTIAREAGISRPTLDAWLTSASSIARGAQ